MDSYEDGEDEDGEDQEAGVMAGRGTWAPAPSLPRHPPSALLWARQGPGSCGAAR